MIRGRTLRPTCTFTPCSRGGSGAANTRRGPSCLRKQNWRTNSAAGLTPPRGRSGHSNATGWPGGFSEKGTYRPDPMLIRASHDAPSRLLLPHATSSPPPISVGIRHRVAALWGFCGARRSLRLARPAAAEYPDTASLRIPMTNFLVTQRHRSGLPACGDSAPNAEYARVGCPPGVGSWTHRSSDSARGAGVREVDQPDDYGHKRVGFGS